MEAIAAGSSIIAFLQLADLVLKGYRMISEGIEHAPSEIHVILCEVESLKLIVCSLEQSGQSSIPGLSGPNGAVSMTKDLLEQLEKLVPSMEPATTPGKKAKQKWFMLVWLRRGPEVRKLLAQILQQKATMLLALDGNTARRVEELSVGVKKIEDAMTDSQRNEVFKWLQKTDPTSKHSESLKLHEKQTSDWIIRLPQWADWVDASSPHRFVWLHGIPGCGKTVLASFLISQVAAFCMPYRDLGWAFYYCSYANNQDETLPFLCWLVCQFGRQAKFVPKVVTVWYEQRYEPTVPELLDALETILTKFEAAFVIIDGVDESLEQEELANTIRILGKNPRFRKLRVLACSRIYFDLQRIFDGVSVPILMSNSEVEKDIRIFVQAKLASSWRLQRWSQIQDEIEEAMVHGAKGMFRWVVCQVHILERLRTEREIRAALKDLPETLDETYIRIFQKIPKESRSFVHRTLLWICGHDSYVRGPIGRPIPMSVLVCTDPDSPSDGDHDSEYLRDLCGCLIGLISNEEDATLAETDDLEEEEDIKPSLQDPLRVRVQLAHYTVKEFLSSARTREGVVSYFALPEDLVREEFALQVFHHALRADPKVCDEDNGRPLEDIETYSLIAGSLAFRDEDLPIGEKLWDAMLQYLDPSSPHYHRLASIARLRWDAKAVWGPLAWACSSLVQRFSTVPPLDSKAGLLLNLLAARKLRFAERFLHQKDARALLSSEMEVTSCYVNAAGLPKLMGWQTFRGTIPRILAQVSHSSLGGSLHYLLRKHACILDDATALLVLCIASHLDHAKKDMCEIDFLLQHGADPDGDGHGMTPLQIACHCHDYVAVKLLLTAGADPNRVGVEGGPFAAAWSPERASSSPLRIVRSRHYLRDPRLLDENYRGKIERAIKRAGGMDF